jgi:hypothetical protein
METAQRMVLEAAKLAMPNTKVVDENGNPKVVYHGTGSQFYTFRETSDSNELGAGYYFSDSYEMAERYATDETLADNRFRAEALAFDIFTDEMGHSEEDYDDNEFIDDYNESYTQAVERLFGNGHVKSVFLNLENPRIMSRNSESFDPTYRHGYNHYNEGVMAKRFNDGIIDEMFEVWLGGEGTYQEELYYAYLRANDGTDASIDLMTGDVESFIEEHKDNSVVTQISSSYFVAPVGHSKEAEEVFENLSLDARLSKNSVKWLPVVKINSTVKRITVLKIYL